MTSFKKFSSYKKWVSLNKLNTLISCNDRKTQNEWLPATNKPT